MISNEKQHNYDCGGGGGTEVKSLFLKSQGLDSFTSQEKIQQCLKLVPPLPNSAASSTSNRRSEQGYLQFHTAACILSRKSGCSRRNWSNHFSSQAHTPLLTFLSWRYKKPLCQARKGKRVKDHDGLAFEFLICLPVWFLKLACL